MEELKMVWRFISVLGTVFGGYIIFSDFVKKNQSRVTTDKEKQAKAQQDLELKVKELEGIISTQYQELKTQLEGVERSLSEDKASKLTFENRVLSSVEKIDSKMERIQDLVIKVFLSNHQQNQ